MVVIGLIWNQCKISEMFKVFFGNDTIKVRREALDSVDVLRSGGASVVTIEEGNYQSGVIANAAATASLFGEPLVYLVDTPSTNTEMYQEVIDSLELMQDGTHTFIVIESTLLAAEKKRFEKYASEMKEFKSVAKERFNNFALADALAKKDKRLLWLLFNEARLEGIAMEELSGVLWWQLKTLRLAAMTSNAAEAGMKDFPYQKAKRSLSGFVPGELERLSHSFLAIMHDSRRGMFEFDQAFEKWVLSL